MKLFAILRRSFVYPFLLFMAFLTAGVAAAWTGPLSTAPACTSGNPGCDAPLNVSGTAQSKVGGLLVNTGGATNGLIVQTGNVGIGTVSPSGKLDVSCAAGGTCVNTLFRSGGNTTSEAAQVQLTRANGTVDFNIFSNANGTRIKSLGPLFLHAGDVGVSATNQWVTINGNGTVGVGTTAPTNQLTVNSVWGGYTLPEAFSIRGGYPSLTFRSSTTNAVWLMHFSANNYLNWYSATDGIDSTNWVNKMWLGPSGDLGTVSGISAGGNLTAAGNVYAGGAAFYTNGDMYIPWLGQYASQAYCRNSGANCPATATLNAQLGPVVTVGAANAFICSNYGNYLMTGFYVGTCGSGTACVNGTIYCRMVLQ